MGNDLTSNDIQNFKHINEHDKIRCMDAYLIRGIGNMQDVGMSVFNNRNASHTVSLIHRAYNFSLRNGGRYKNGCAFEKQYNYRVSINDIEVFVRAYPNGCWQGGYSFEQFLIERAEQFHKRNQIKQPQQERRQVQYQSSTPTYRPEPKRQETSSRKNYDSHSNHDGLDDFASLGLFLGAIFLGLFLIWKLIKFLWGGLNSLADGIVHIGDGINWFYFFILVTLYFGIKEYFFKK